MPDTFPVLHTNRLDLIEITEAHIPDIFTLFTDERVTKYYNVVPFATHDDVKPILDIFRERFAKKTGIRWGITLKGGTKLIGNIGFNSYTQGHRSTIGYALMPEHWGRGYITEAIKAIVDYGFETLLVNRIEAEVIPGNTASEVVLVKLGFKHEGLLRQWMLWNAQYNDINMYALLKEDMR